MDKKTNLKISILAIICIIIFCFAISPITLQNDTYYTIKIGEHITQNGIDMQDHFSWHEDLPYTYPHWAYDTGLYLIYNLGQMTGITDGGMLFVYLATTILACILGILIYFTSTKLTKNRIVSFIIAIGSIYLLRNFIAARAQLVSYILFVLAILFIEKFLENKKKRYLIGLVLISIFLANIHVAVWPFFFVIFLPYIAEYVIATVADWNVICRINIFYKKDDIKSIENKLKRIEKNKQKNKYKTEEDYLNIKQKTEERLEKAKLVLEKANEKLKTVKEKSVKLREKPFKIKIQKNKAVRWLVLVMIVCALTGLLTPIGDTPYTYLVKTMQGTTTSNISEHLPLTLFNDKPTMVVLALLLAILIFTDTKIKLSDLFMIAGLIYMSFMSRRQTSLFVLIGCFIFAKLVTSLINKYDKNNFEKVAKFVSSIFGRIIVICIIAIMSLYFFKPKADDKFVNSTTYPVDAATWMLENLDVQNIKLYNEYNYGSYLVFRGIPVFIDSRADLYAPEFNRTKDEDGKYEGRDIFSDYINISSIGTYYEDKFEKYGITHAIVVKNAKLNMFLSRNDKYKQLYDDDKFVIYQRNS